MIRIASAATISLALFFSATAVARQNDQAQAKKFFRVGKRLFKKKKYRDAIVALEKAYRLWKHRVIEFNLALGHAHLGENIRAMTYLRRFLAKAPPAERTLPPILQKVRQSVGVLIIQLPDKRAAIYVDGRLAGHGRVELVVQPGPKKIEIRLGKRRVAQKTIAVTAGGEKSWELAEMPRPQVRRRPEIRKQPRPPPRRHARPAATVTTKPRSSRRLHWGYLTAAAIVTVGALAGAVATGLKTKQLHDDFLASGRTEPAFHNDGLKYQKIANALWGVTAAATLTTVLLAIFTRWRRPERNTAQVTAKPNIWPGGGGVTVTW